MPEKGIDFSGNEVEKWAIAWYIIWI